MNRSITILACTLLPYLVLAQVTNPEVTQDNIRQTICTSGWTRAVRPPTSYTEPIKQHLLTDFGGDPKDYELDHIIPLAVGGIPQTGPTFSCSCGRGRTEPRLKTP